MKKKPMKSNKPKTNIPKSRKELRKESRKAKKVKKHEHYIKFHSKKNKQELGKGNDKNKAVFNKGKKIKNFNETHDNNNKMPFDETKSNKFQSIFDEHVCEKSQEEAKKKKLEKQFQQNRLEKFKIENEEEEKVIKTLEKKLKLKKRKNKAAAFAMDGLDYVLGVCDKETFGDKSENNIYDSDSDFVSDLAVVSGKKVEKSKKEPKEKNKKQKDDDDNDDNSDVEGEEEFDESVAGEEDFNESDEEEEDFNESDEEQDDEEGKHEEDIDSSDFSVDSDPDDTVELPSNKIKKRKILKSAKLPSSKRKKQESESEEYDEFDSDENNEEAEDGDSNGGSSDDDSIIATEESLSDKKNEIKDNELTEDIYGRLKDKKGNLVSTYKPPQLRNAIANTPAGKNQEKLQKLRRQLKGLLNRLAENNMNSISNQIEQLYMSNSRNDMNETLCQLFHEALVSEVLTPERLVMEHAMLIAILHGNVGSEVSAHFLQHMVTHLDKLLKEDLNVEDKRVNNLLLFIMHLYNFRIFHSQLMYDIIDVLLEKLEEKQIELILLVFRTVGFALRKDDPVALKSLVLKVQDKANTISTDDKGSRVKFMLEMVLAIKNNNMSKIPNYNPEVVERLRKSLKMLIRKGNFTSELKISLKDLLNAEKHGRWWIVGSAWSGTAPTEHNANKAEEKSSVANTFSQKLLDLAKKQRMNTDVRRNIFCILMSAEDYLEAFEKLIKLGLKGAVEREIMNVLIHCALQEKQFNPYYYHLANKFCTFDRKYQMMLQYAVWDKIKDIDNLIPQQVTNLAKFLGSVILAKGLPISVLKVIQFAEMEKPSVKFIRQVLLTILLFDDQEEVAAVFRKISNSNKLKVFREGLRLFLHHFVLRNVKNATEENVKLLKERVDLADKALSASDLDLAF